MSRSDPDRLLDILEASAASAGHLQRCPLTDGRRLRRCAGPAHRDRRGDEGFDPDLLDQQPHIPWRQVAAMRNQLAHRYFDTPDILVQHTIEADLPELTAAVQALLDGSAARLIRPTDSRTPQNFTRLCGSVPLLTLAHDRQESRSKLCL